MNIDAAVQQAIQEHAEWAKGAGGFSEPIQPRVLAKLEYADRWALRRPFRKKGRDGVTAWVIRWYGFPRLTNPRKNKQGVTVFDATYG